MSSKNRISAVIFDMDGVLIDAVEWHYEALNRALGNVGVSISEDLHRSELDGLPTRVKLDFLTNTIGLPRALHATINHVKQVETLRIAAMKCQVRLEVLGLLQTLKKAGVPTAVATNSIRMTTEVMLSLSGLRQFFTLVLTNEDVTNPKPDPEIYETACRLLGVNPDSTLVIEDSAHGVTAAESAGCRVLRLLDPNQLNKETLSSNGFELWH